MSFVFCFKQKTAYEMRISDWSSDVCASDLKSEMDAQKKTFVEGAVARGVPEDQAAAIFDQVEKFAGYGFNKSHAAAYALVAYQTAYLKANYPVEFMAAPMTLQLGNTNKHNAFPPALARTGVRKRTRHR